MNASDKIKGALYGLALGDALGIGTEFMTVDEIHNYYPDGLTDFTQFIRDAHRATFQRGSWSANTEVVLRLIETIANHKDIRLKDVAHTLREWYLESPEDVMPVYRAVIGNPRWEDNPITECHSTWRERNITEATNEAIHRALIIAVISESDTDIHRWCHRLVSLTHDDIRCMASTAVIAKWLHSMIIEGKEASREDLEQFCRQIDSRTLIYIKAAGDGDLSNLHLDDEDTYWYTRKSMASALWAIWHLDSPEAILREIVHAGGDANTNASLAVMCAGAKYGYDALPPLKDKILNRERLDKAIDQLISIRGYGKSHNM